MVAAAAGVGLALVGGVLGAVLGAVAASATRGRRRQVRARSAAQAAEVAVREQLATAADLLAGCLAAGASPGEAAAAVGESLRGPVGERLRHTAAELRLGGEADASWGRFAELPGARELGRCLARAGTSGVPAVESVSRIAADLRSEWGRAATEAARKAGVLVTLPLAVCFLPAFLTIGVAPVLVGLAQDLLPHV
ncbi:type II secretion system F family protein [Streptomyces ochraceiscleroticus]|uniref:Type II secretion system F family protein n=1 Tax=Streptomyces ochraceiscleroticus TaxID=47761 RepID=A0ABW1MMV1_9ACTN|nr:type II secretion system F family protein [Streptomyces ochraceiscleroticus]